MLYNWIVFLHVASVFAFLMAHGVSMAVSFQLRAERQLDRARGLLELSAGMYRVLYPSLILILLTGILLGILQNIWFHQGWYWTSLVVLVLELFAMSGIAQRDYTPLRKALGLPYFANNRLQPPLAAAPDAESLALLQRVRPGLLAGIGGVGLLLLLWLMMLKPF